MSCGIQVSYMRGSGCVACCCVMTEDRIFMCHENVQTNCVRTLASLSIALINALFVDPEAETCCLLVTAAVFCFVLGQRWANYGPRACQSIFCGPYMLQSYVILIFLLFVLSLQF